MIKQMTLRQVPDAVEKGIRGRARRTGHSLNRTMIALMEETLGIRTTEKKRRDMSRFAGQWSNEECAAFDRNTFVFEHVDEETWKT